MRESIHFFVGGGTPYEYKSLSINYTFVGLPLCVSWLEEWQHFFIAASGGRKFSSRQWSTSTAFNCYFAVQELCFVRDMVSDIFLHQHYLLDPFGSLATMIRQTGSLSVKGSLLARHCIKPLNQALLAPDIRDQEGKLISLNHHRLLINPMYSWKKNNNI